MTINYMVDCTYPIEKLYKNRKLIHLHENNCCGSFLRSNNGMHRLTKSLFYSNIKSNNLMFRMNNNFV